MKVTIKNLPFLIVDLFAFYLALFLALTIRLGANFNLEIYNFHFRKFTWPLLFFLVILYVLGLYDLRNLSRLFKYFRLLTTGAAVFFVFSTLYFYFFPIANISPKTILVLFTLILGGVDFTLREFLRRYLIKSQPLSSALMIAKGDDAEELNRYIGENPQLGYKITNWIKEYDIHAIDEALAQNKNNIIIIPSQMRSDRFFSKKIYEKLLKGTDVIGFSEFYENTLGKVSMDELKENWFLEKIKPRDGLYPLVKRMIDIFLAFLVLVITWPLWLVIALLIKISSKGPALYLKERVSLQENKFILYKFRTMHEGGEEIHKLREDFSTERGDAKRVFGFGKFLRRARLDELPQVINVLKGELSFVGPRADFVDYYNILKEKIPYYQIRTIILPGLSGWGQIHDKFGNSKDSAIERLAYDIFYIKNRSLMLDVAISLKTLKTLLTLSGT
ncbi:MAG: sugar transferase [Candidatus Liptonbacteria bacterium]|nr:sugar transferase [Candidatus Liptonbacteria bacterium]